MARSWDELSEWTKRPPEDWETRLRAISPIVDRTSHLRFRWRASVEQWELYECTPLPLVSAERIAQLSQHWSELPPSQQHGRKRYVTEYQHYMFRTHGVDARRFWVLQGNTGGTPAVFTERERKLLEAIGESGEVIPLGTLPYAPFDERAVRAILQRDKLLHAGYDLDRLAAMSRPDALKAADDADDKEYRAKFLEWWYAEMAPAAEFMKWYHRQTEAHQTMRRATQAEANAVTQWRDHYIETGDVIGAGAATSKALQVAVL